MEKKRVAMIETFHYNLSMPIKSLRKIKTEIISPPKVGEIVEGKILERGRSSIFLDLGPKGIGIIYGKEFHVAKDALKNLNIGDKILAKVINLENEKGYRELSLAQASQEIAWEELRQIKEKGEIIEIQIKGANKGGLIAELKGIQGFLPASQLLPQNYPKVTDAEPAKIAKALQKFVGQKMKVKIFDVNQKEGKLIFSEKLTKKEKTEKELIKYKVGDVVEGEISGVTSFGAFIKFGEDLEGLIRASEISEGKGESPIEILKIGQKVKAKIVEIINNRIYLSLKEK